MKKLIGAIQPFDKFQTFYIYNDGQIIDNFQSSLQELPRILLQKVKNYQIEEIALSGSKSFLEGLTEKIINKEPYYFTKNKVTIKYI